ncbi:MAG: hypothetical protein ACYC0A_12490 [Lutibacter sp.]
MASLMYIVALAKDALLPLLDYIEFYFWGWDLVKSFGYTAGIGAAITGYWIHCPAVIYRISMPLLFFVYLKVYVKNVA